MIFLPTSQLNLVPKNSFPLDWQLQSLKQSETSKRSQDE
ncbi:hypothetical protein LEP1GSC020_4144 [Leptospira interrogans serovar Grippotyphosa str. 2006006986]|nr:hypothetical protein LEP1GSC020_4144 [Leptospira interrogans serovar Grippotyphosa str. 2006006986]